jgi:hypothetical protein
MLYSLLYFSVSFYFFLYFFLVFSFLFAKSPHFSCRFTVPRNFLRGTINVIRNLI